MRGRSRQLRPEFFSDERLGDLEQQSGLPLFRVFMGLLVFADREGRFRWAPRALRGAISPCFDGDFAACLEALASRSFVVLYRVAGEDFGVIPDFDRWVSVHPKEPRSDLPPPQAHGSREIPGDSGKNLDESLKRLEVGEGVPGPFVVPNTTHINTTKEQGSNARARGDATALHRERPDPPSGSRPVRIFTMPSEEPTKEFLDYAVMAGVSPEQARSTWSHYVGAGLPERGVERLHWWLTQRAKERAAKLAKMPSAGPTDALQRAADRVTRLREQEAAEEERQRAAGGNG